MTPKKRQTTFFYKLTLNADDPEYCILLPNKHVLNWKLENYYMYKSTRNQKNIEKCSTYADLHTDILQVHLN